MTARDRDCGRSGEIFWLLAFIAMGTSCYASVGESQPKDGGYVWICNNDVVIVMRAMGVLHLLGGFQWTKHREHVKRLACRIVFRLVSLWNASQKKLMLQAVAECVRSFIQEGFGGFGLVCTKILNHCEQFFSDEFKLSSAPYLKM